MAIIKGEPIEWSDAVIGDVVWIGPDHYAESSYVVCAVPGNQFPKGADMVSTHGNTWTGGPSTDGRIFVLSETSTVRRTGHDPSLIPDWYKEKYRTVSPDSPDATWVAFVRRR